MSFNPYAFDFTVVEKYRPVWIGLKRGLFTGLVSHFYYNPNFKVFPQH